MVNRMYQFAVAAFAMSLGGVNAVRTNLPAGGELSWKRWRNTVKYPHSCWRPGPEHLPPPGRSRQVRRREALKAGVVKWRDMK